MEKASWEGSRKFQLCIWNDERRNWQALPTVYDRFREARADMEAYATENGIALYSGIMVYSTTTVAKCGIAA